MTETTARHALPLLAPGQAQKELFHNEALALIDVLLQPAVTATGLDTPPVAPVEGTCWIVGANPTGAWAGMAGRLAGWTAGGWRFAAPREGMRCATGAGAPDLRYQDGEWLPETVTGTALRIDGAQVVGQRQPAIATPAGGTTVDTGCRSAVAAILQALRTHGLIAT